MKLKLVAAALVLALFGFVATTWWALESYSDPYTDVRQSIQRVLMTPFIPHKEHVRGFVYDVKTGQLHEVKAHGPARGGSPAD